MSRTRIRDNIAQRVFKACPTYRNKSIYNPNVMAKDKRLLLEASAKLCKLAYFDPDTIQATTDKLYSLDFTCVPGYPKIASKDDAQAYVWKFNEFSDDAALHGTIFVVFRGTRDIGDGLDSIDVRQTPFCSDGVRVHTGFHRQFTQIVQDLEAYLEMESSNKTIVFCGHSLGGAIATLASVYFANKYWVHCYTFGSPRVGNMEFCKLFESSVTDHMRVVTSNDPVPMIPISFRFNHVGPAMIVDDDCKVFEVKNDIPWYLRLFYHIVKLDLLRLILDHEAEVYIERIGKMFQKT
jgi:hypothetical protein